MRPGSRLARVAVVAVAAAALAAACSDDGPTQVGSDLRTPPDTLYTLDVTNVVQDSVFALPVSLRNSIVGTVGAQGAYTSQILYDFRVPTFVVDEGETLALDTGRFTADLTKATTPPYPGHLRLGMSEVEPSARGWSTSAVYDSTVLTRLPALRAAVVAGEDTVAGDDFVLDDPRISIPVQVRSLADYDTVAARRGTLVVNMALLFRGFADGGPGFVDFRQVTAALAPLPRFVGVYASGTTTGVESSVAPSRQLVVVEFDSTYSARSNWVVSDAQRFHTFFKFPDLATLRSQLPADAVVHRADLILTQAARGDTIFGGDTIAGLAQNVGITVPSDAVLTDPSRVYTESENNRAVAFKSPFTAAAGSEFVVTVTAYLFDQQEGTVQNRGMILRLSNEGTRARHFEFYGPAALDPAVRPRLRLLYSLPADFGEDRP